MTIEGRGTAAPFALPWDSDCTLKWEFRTAAGAAYDASGSTWRVEILRNGTVLKTATLVTDDLADGDLWSTWLQADLAELYQAGGNLQARLRNHSDSTTWIVGPAEIRPTGADAPSAQTIPVTVTSSTVQVTVGGTGPRGAAGAAGDDGDDGLGVPAGGTTGQVLSKASNADNDTAWITAAAASGATIGLVWLYRTNQTLATSTVIPGTGGAGFLPAGTKVGFTGQSTASENGYYEADGSGGVDVGSKVEFVTQANAGRPVFAQITWDDRSGETDSNFTAVEPYLSTRNDDPTLAAAYVVDYTPPASPVLRPINLSPAAAASLLGTMFAPAMDDYSISFGDVDGDGEYHLGLHHGINVVDTSGGDITIVLGPHAEIPRHCYIWHRVGGNTLTIENLPGDGNSYSRTLAAGECIDVRPHGADWNGWPQFRPQAKGDLFVGAAAEDARRLPVGSNDQILYADSAETTGMRWGAAPSGGGTDAGFPIVSGQYAHPPVDSVTVFALTTVNRVYYVPFHTGGGDVDEIRCNVQTAGDAGSTLRLGVYGDTDGWPGSLIFDAGTVAAETTGGKAIAISETIPAGWIWLCIAAQGGTTAPIMRASSGPTRNGIRSAPPTTSPTGPVRSTIGGESGALPATANVDSYHTAAAFPNIGLQGA